MLSYRHAFHAGSPADMLKHAVFAFVLREAVAAAPGPLYVLDTHAGAGGYDLRSDAAAKTGEARAGVLRLWDAPEPWPALLAPYRELVRAANPAGGVVRYPGSPLIAAALLRPGDRLELVELHPTDHAVLAGRFLGASGVSVAREDGLAALVARMPPPERRAVALIDPSYEIKSDFDDVVTALARAHRRMGVGTFILWYPIIDRARAAALLDAMRATRIRRQYRIELGMAPDAPGRGMTGSGLVVVNPPPALPAAAEEALPWIAARLGAAGATGAGWLSAG